MDQLINDEFFTRGTIHPTPYGKMVNGKWLPIL